MHLIRASFSITFLLICGAVVLPGAAAQDLAPPSYKMSTLMGQEVKNQHGNEVGVIEDVVIEAASGDLVYAVLAVDGFLGIGEKLFAIPWRALQQPIGSKTFRLETTAEQLKKAPRFDRRQWPDLEDRHWGDTIHAYYGQPPYWGKRLPTTTGRETVPSIEASKERLLRVSHVLKAEVMNTQGQKLGDIDEIVIDSAADNITYAVLSVGRGLDLGDRLFAIPWGALRQSAGLGTFLLDVDKKTLQEAAGFDKDHWPQRANPRWGG